jgi:cytochrome c1
MLTTRQTSQRFGGLHPPQSNLDLNNPDQAKQANQEVIAFLQWLDEKSSDGRVGRTNT